MAYVTVTNLSNNDVAALSGPRRRCRHVESAVPPGLYLDLPYFPRHQPDRARRHADCRRIRHDTYRLSIDDNLPGHQLPGKTIDGTQPIDWTQIPGVLSDYAAALRIPLPRCPISSSKLVRPGAITLRCWTSTLI